MRIHTTKYVKISPRMCVVCRETGAVRQFNLTTALACSTVKLKKQSEAWLRNTVSSSLSRTREISRLMLKLKQSLQEFSDLQPYDFFFPFHTSSQILQGLAVFVYQHGFCLSPLHYLVGFDFHKPSHFQLNQYCTRRSVVKDGIFLVVIHQLYPRLFKKTFNKILKINVRILLLLRSLGMADCATVIHQTFIRHSSIKC